MPASSKLNTLPSFLQAAHVVVLRWLQVPQAVLTALLVAVAPIALCEVVMKVMRIASYHSPLTTYRRLSLLGSDLAVIAALCGLMLVIAVACTLARLPRVSVLLSQVVLLVVFTIDLFAHGYFRSTGLTLDYSMFAFALSRVSETAPVVASEITPVLWVMVFALPLALLAAPWLVMRRAVRNEPIVAWSAVGDAGALRRALLSMLIGATVAVVFTCVAFRIKVARVEVSFAHDPVVQLASSYWAGRASSSDDGRKVAPRKTGAHALTRSASAAPFNVVVIILESTRADATTPYVPTLKTTPFLAKLATQSTRVERAYAVVPHTSKALVSILCGYEPRSSLAVVESQKDGLPGSCLARLLEGVGYDTAFFQAPKHDFERRDQLVSNMGYQHFVAGDQAPQEGLEHINYLGMEDAVMLKPSETWLQTAKEPLFATYLTSATHHPYDSPKSHKSQRFTGQGRKNEYLNALNYVDSVVGKIYDQYESRGLLDRTVFVVVGDHGEGFREHGLSAHDDILYEEGIRVPLLFKLPKSVKRPARIAGPVNQLAIVPTVLDVLGYRATVGGYEESSVYAPHSSRPLFLACYRKAQCVAVIRDHYKLTYYFDDKPTQLFDLRTDPKELKDIASSRPALVSAWSREAVDWVRAVEEAHRASSAQTLKAFLKNTRPEATPDDKHVTFGKFIEALSCNARRRPRGWINFHCVYNVVGAPGTAVKLRVYARAKSESRVWDHAPVSGLYPLLDWKKGEYITDDFPVVVTEWSDESIELCLSLEDAKGNKLTTVPEQPIDCMPLGTLQPYQKTDDDEPAPPAVVPDVAAP